MWTIYQEIEQAWTKAYGHIQRSPDDRGVFPDFILDQEQNARQTAVVELQPWLAIFELSLEWLSYVHVALTNGLKPESENRYRAAWALIGAAVSFGLSIRMLCISGFDTPAKALLRSYTEALLLCLTALDDSQIADAFVGSEGDEDIKNFWHTLASPKNLHKRIVEIEKRSGLVSEDVNAMMMWRREEYEILAQSSHLSYPASVLTCRTQPLNGGGEGLEIGIWGAASAWSHRTIFYAAATTWYFSRFSYVHLIGKQPSDGTLLTLNREDEWQRKIVLGRDVLANFVLAHWGGGSEP